MAKTRKRNNAKEQDTIDIPESEQWRLINESGVLKQAPLVSIKPNDLALSPTTRIDEEEDLPLVEELFNALVLITPFSFLLLTMEILIHQQYGRKPSIPDILERMLPGIPVLSLFIFYTLRYKRSRHIHAILFFLSVATGSRFLWIMNRSSYLVNMKQAPPLITIWVYTIVQLDLGPAVVALALVGMFAWWKRLTQGWPF